MKKMLLMSCLLLSAWSTQAAPIPQHAGETPFLGTDTKLNADAKPVLIGSLGSVDATLPGLARAISAGNEDACAPTHLTISGTASSGKRFYASAPLNDFSRSVRDASRAGAKLTPTQSHAIERLLAKAKNAVQSGQGFPVDILNQSAREIGMKVQSQMLCLSSKTQESTP